VRDARLAVLLACLILLDPRDAAAEPVPVRRTEGLVHGFLALRSLDGAHLADGDLIQVARGDRVTSHLVFRFKDGSVHDETAVYTQRRVFRLVSHHLIQKGPTFPRPIDMTTDAIGGRVTVRYADEDGTPKVEEESLTIPPDVANGMTLTLMKNIRAGGTAGPLPTLSMIAATPKPRLVKLEITSAGEDRFTTGRAARKATHYVVKVEIGGLAGLVAPLVGKQPPDTHVWVLGGEAPAFVKSEGPMFLGGPIWRIELVSPTWK
jgi:hypothetical protein